jgi:CubicO group peptidase (beta-lactamase class C family)
MARHLYSRPGHATEFKKKALTPTEPLTLQQLPGWLQQEFGQHGVAIALIDGQQVQYQLHGLADTGQQRVVSRETLFEIGSVSKPLTALAVLSVAAQQNWQLERPLAQQFAMPELATHQYTLTELLTHRSGLPRLPANLPLDDLRNPYARYHDNELRAALTTTDFTERQFGYSNYGYGLLGWLLATELKQSYAELMQQRVFQPLAMPTAKVQLSLPAHAGTPPALSKLARGYAINGEQVANWQFDSLAGAGAVVASIEDMAGMLQQIFANANTDPLLQLWLTPLQLNDQPAMTPGWMLTAKGWHWHAGQTAGFSSLVVFDPTQQKGLVILSNIALPVTEQGMALFADWLAKSATTLLPQDKQP